MASGLSVGPGSAWVRRPQPGPVPSERMGHRMLYMTARFGEHSPRWQLVIWLRQFALVLLVFASITGTVTVTIRAE